MAEEAVALDPANIQGLVFGGWGRTMPWTAFVFATLHDGSDARTWLGALPITTSVREAQPADARVQVALSPSGLAALGVDDDGRARFAQELTLGMAARKRILGDEDAGDPSTWTLLRAGTRCDALVLLYAATEERRDALVEEHRALVTRHHGEVIAVEKGGPWRDREPFGFADGLSQPFVEGLPGAPARGQQTIRAGEILLGYTNQYDRMPQSPRWRGFDLGLDGTYLVFRKLEQDVVGFWQYFAAQGRALAGQAPVPRDPDDAAVWLASRVLGRWPSGASLVQSPDRDDPGWADPSVANAFGYLEQDPDGLRCPIASHVRRANPRDDRGGDAATSFTVVDRHRLLRRGRAYGPALDPADIIAGRTPGGGAAASSGLYFMSLQSSIARGFEFIQQTWNINPSFRGLFDEPDPLIGPGGGHFSIPCTPLRLRLSNLPRFTTTRGGAYFFLPSLRALHRLAGH